MADPYQSVKLLFDTIDIYIKTKYSDDIQSFNTSIESLVSIFLRLIIINIIDTNDKITDRLKFLKTKFVKGIDYDAELDIYDDYLKGVVNKLAATKSIKLADLYTEFDKAKNTLNTLLKITNTLELKQYSDTDFKIEITDNFIPILTNLESKIKGGSIPRRLPSRANVVASHPISDKPNIDDLISQRKNAVVRALAAETARKAAEDKAARLDAAVKATEVEARRVSEAATAEAAGVRSENSELREALRRAQEAAAQAAAQAQAAKTQAEEARAELIVQSASAEEKLREAAAKVATATEKITGLDQQLSELKDVRTELSVAAARNSALERDIKAIREAKAEEIQAAQVAFEEKRAALEAQIAASANAAGAELQGLRTELSDLVKEHLRELTALKAELKALKEREAALVVTNAALQTDLIETNEKLARALRDLADAKRELQTYEQIQAVAELAMDDHIQTYEALTQTIEAMAAERVRRAKTVADIQRRLQEAEAEAAASAGAQATAEAAAEQAAAAAEAEAEARAAAEAAVLAAQADAAAVLVTKQAELTELQEQLERAGADRGIPQEVLPELGGILQRLQNALTARGEAPAEATTPEDIADFEAVLSGLKDALTRLEKRPSAPVDPDAALPDDPAEMNDYILGRFKHSTSDAQGVLSAIRRLRGDTKAATAPASSKVDAAIAKVIAAAAATGATAAPVMPISAAAAIVMEEAAKRREPEITPAGGALRGGAAAHPLTTFLTRQRVPVNIKTAFLGTGFVLLVACYFAVMTLMSRGWVVSLVSAAMAFILLYIVAWTLVFLRWGGELASGMTVGLLVAHFAAVYLLLMFSVRGATMPLAGVVETAEEKKKRMETLTVRIYTVWILASLAVAFV